MSDIAKQLRALRKQCGKRLQDVAEETGLSMAYLSDIERGNRASLTSAVMTLNKVLACYGMELHVELRPKPSEEG